MLVNGKRKAGAMPVPRSMYSYLMGALQTDFDQLQGCIIRGCTSGTNKEAPNNFADLLIEEMFRYLYLLGDNSCDGTVRSSPSFLVDQALQCLLRDPVLYFQSCNAILNMQGKHSDEVPMRVLPYNSLQGSAEDEAAKKKCYQETVARYKQTFKTEPPSFFWPAYCSDLLIPLMPTAFRCACYLPVHDGLEWQDCAGMVRITDKESENPSAVGVTNTTTLHEVLSAYLKNDEKNPQDYYFICNGTKLDYNSTRPAHELDASNITCARATFQIGPCSFGHGMFFNVYRSMRMSRVMFAFADRFNKQLEKLRFYCALPWRRIAFEDTAAGLRLKEGDLVHVTCVDEDESEDGSEDGSDEC